MTVLNGEQVANKILGSLKNKVLELKQDGVTPGLAVVLVGNNAASEKYVARKTRACEAIGVYSELHRLPESVGEQELIQLIEKHNENPAIHGILVQLPLPNHLDKNLVLSTVSVEKDVDGLHPKNLGGLFDGTSLFQPCTAKGVVKLIEETRVDLVGKHCVVVGRSKVVGLPTALMLLQKNALVTIAHSKTQNLKDVCKQADVLVVAAGKPNLVNSEMVKPGAIVVDVGVNRVEENGKQKLVGDVDFNSVKEVASVITPVPGGVGPMTVAMLMENVVEAASSKAWEAPATNSGIF